MLVTCINRERNSSGQILYYDIMDENNNKVRLTSEQLKSAIRSKKVICTNLTLTKNNKLMLTKTKAIAYENNKNKHIRSNLSQLDLSKLTLDEIKAHMERVMQASIKVMFRSNTQLTCCVGHLPLIMDRLEDGGVGFDIPLPLKDIDSKYLRGFDRDGDFIYIEISPAQPNLLYNICDLYKHYSLKNTAIPNYDTVFELLGRALGNAWGSNFVIDELWSQDAGQYCLCYNIDAKNAVASLKSTLHGYECIIEKDGHSKSVRIDTLTKNISQQKNVYILLYGLLQQIKC